MCVCVCVCPSQAIPRKLIVIIKFGTVTASVMTMHRVLIILTLIFIQGHTDITLNVRLFPFSSNTDHVCCEDSPTKGLYNLFVVR